MDSATSILVFDKLFCCSELLLFDVVSNLVVNPHTQNHKKSPTVEEDKGTGWVMPDVGWVKFHFDGSFCGDTGAAGIGCIMRDESGMCLGAYSRLVEGITSSHEVEAASLFEASRLAADSGLEKVILEGDAKLVVDGMQKVRQGETTEDASRAANYFEEANIQLGRFRDDQIAWCRRVKNMQQQQFN